MSQPVDSSISESVKSLNFDMPKIDYESSDRGSVIGEFDHRYCKDVTINQYGDQILNNSTDISSETNKLNNSDNIIVISTDETSATDSPNCSINTISVIDDKMDITGKETKDIECKWKNCFMYFEPHKMLQHVINHTFVNDNRINGKKQYVCFWKGCKVYSIPSTSHNWLMRHVESHLAELKPYLCVVTNCDFRFKSASSLTRHINGHFKKEARHSSPKSKISKSKDDVSVEQNLNNIEHIEIDEMLYPNSQFSFSERVESEAPCYTSSPNKNLKQEVSDSNEKPTYSKKHKTKSKKRKKKNTPQKVNFLPPIGHSQYFNNLNTLFSTNCLLNYLNEETDYFYFIPESHSAILPHKIITIFNDITSRQQFLLHQYGYGQLAINQWIKPSNSQCGVDLFVPNIKKAGRYLQIHETILDNVVFNRNRSRNRRK
ncbi:hypothetical protein A3Q56_07311 [Intoshia linei]|uniref:C2H2-type domain-containing protein n=1 Tax=Intoshia linei TaxID=1819745 RepID=A0A177ASL2_9BILA|nr:hypothetical protein A3Q56_07311 [Intoshia linei]